MSDPVPGSSGSAWFPMHPDVRIAVENFGPIESGVVDLRPLTIFVGPSNAGKTYFAILIYALHRVLSGFRRVPMRGDHLVSPGTSGTLMHERVFENIFAKLDADWRSVRFSDLHEIIHPHDLFLFDYEPGYPADDLRIELQRCFDLEWVGDLIRTSAISEEAMLSLAVSEDTRKLWDFHAGVSQDSDIDVDGRIEDPILFKLENPQSEPIFMKRNGGIRQAPINRGLIQYSWREGVEGEQSTDEPERLVNASGFLDMLFHTTQEDHAETHYLPATRSGIMQSHRVIASSLMALSTRAGLARLPELPTFTGVISDFMQRLLLYDAPAPHSRARSRHKSAKTIEALAAILENQTLGGQILTKSTTPGGYPEFFYRPADAKQDIRLNRASSMVSELAPVVLFLRGNIRYGDTLIIEEPEAHLHPAAQTGMAAILARLVRSGVRVVVTTHSDWLLKEIGNLIREGELEGQAGESAGAPASPGALRSRDVGIWLFGKDGASQGSTIREIEFDRVEGIEPSDYEDVAEQLYNRSADLQNRLEETACGKPDA